MATKLQNISELARQTTERLTQSVDNWKRFLDSAAWLYKYPFHEQVLIHAQRPDAKACAPIELWNSRFRRWVNRGAKGIAIIDDSGHKPALRYVFDVSDTNTRYNIPFRLWQTKSQYTAQIIEELQKPFRGHWRGERQYGCYRTGHIHQRRVGQLPRLLRGASQSGGQQRTRGYER